MTLNKFIENLLSLQEQGHGDKEVYYRLGTSGDCGRLGLATITDEVDACCGPFDLWAEGEQYVEVYAGS